jgi:hypothetical protein
MQKHLAFAFVILAAACSGDDDAPSADAPAGGADAPSGADSGTPGNWTPLITGEWTLPAGGENTSDVHQIVLDRDIYVGAIRPIEPPGTHHTLLALDSIGSGNIIYASGVGTNEIVFPPGVGLRLTAGSTLALQLHVFNTSEDPLAGTSGVEIIEVAEADVQNVAGLWLPGPIALSIPPMQEHTQTGTCTASETVTIFAIFPHMHQLGSYFRTTLNVGGNDMILHDGPYNFTDQAFIPFEPLTLNAGDTITTECTWNNTTDQTVTWGESSTTEMCFSILYRYPVVSGPEFCF